MSLKRVDAGRQKLMTSLDCGQPINNSINDVPKSRVTMFHTTEAFGGSLLVMPMYP